MKLPESLRSPLDSGRFCLQGQGFRGTSTFAAAQDEEILVCSYRNGATRIGPLASEQWSAVPASAPGRRPMGAAGVSPTAPTERSLPPQGVGVGVGVSTGVGVGVPVPGWLLG
jgi:hypothetical protein